MANFRLDQTGMKDLQTTFRFGIYLRPDASATALGLTEAVTGYIISCDLPAAPGEPITWHLPGGMKNYQAGKRTTRPISLTFVVSSNAADGSIYKLLEKWSKATYNLNDGTNIGKAKYCTDAIHILVKGEDDNVKYTFHLIRAQVTDCQYGQVNSESNDLIKVSCTIYYDNYAVYKGDTTQILSAS